jgi:hypothetical protein
MGGPSNLAEKLLAAAREQGRREAVTMLRQRAGQLCQGGMPNDILRDFEGRVLAAAALAIERGDWKAGDDE